MHINRNVKIMVIMKVSGLLANLVELAIFEATAILIMFNCRLPYQIRRIILCKLLDIFFVLGIYFVRHCPF